MLKNEAFFNKMTSSWNMVDRNLMVLHLQFHEPDVGMNFDMIPNTLGLHLSPKLWQSLQSLSQTAVDTLWFTSHPISIHIDDNLNQFFKNLDSSLHKTCFQSSSYVIWNTSAFPSGFFTGTVALKHFWWGFHEEQMNQLKCQTCLSGPVSGFWSFLSYSLRLWF